MTNIEPNARRGYESVRRVLAEDGWVVTEHDNQTLTANGDDELCPVSYFFRVHFERCQFLFYIVPEIEVPEYLMAQAAEYICRVNSGMRIGNFELDFNNGHVRFKSSIQFGDTELSASLVRSVMEPALAAYGEYFEGLSRVLAKVATPFEAINAIDFEPE